VLEGEIESGVGDLKDFCFTGDDHRYRLDVEAKRWFLYFIKQRFNAGVKHKGKIWKWDTTILNKTGLEASRKRTFVWAETETWVS